jgi:multiple antibiotic resistance protein
MARAQLFNLAVTFFLIMDPLGNIPLFISLLGKRTPKDQRRIILRELLIALGIMILFFFLGDMILDLLHISKYTVQISGGVILFLIALQMIFPKVSNGKDKEVQSEPFIVPLAVPLVAGPSLLATIAIAWIATTVILLSSSWFAKIMGTRGLKACERMMGLILTLLAVQLLLEGVTTFVQYKP